MSTLLRRLQGGNLEVFKVPYLPTMHPPPSSLPLSATVSHQLKILTQFGIYILFPIGWMYYFGTNLDDRFNVTGFWPSAEQSHKIPLEKEEIDRELARMRTLDAVRRERREQMQAQAQMQSQAQSQIQGGENGGQ